MFDIYLSKSRGTDCPYLAGKVWTTEFFEARCVPESFYEALLNGGFRRSGGLFYRNICGGCTECRQMRIPVSRFVPTDSQKRSVRKNADVRLELARAEFREDVFALYKRYCAYQHDKADESERDFRLFLCASPLDTRMSLYYAGEKLIAAGWLDFLPAGLSSVYFAFEPEEARRSLGVFSVMREIALAREMGLPYYYLGFIVEDSPKMSYKAAFRPQERLIDERWTEF
jgi:arginine-tRNA-protein transferase